MVILTGAMHKSTTGLFVWLPCTMFSQLALLTSNINSSVPRVRDFDKNLGQPTAFMKSSVSRSIKLNQNRGGFRRTTFVSIHVKIEDQSWFIFNLFVKKEWLRLTGHQTGKLTPSARQMCIYKPRCFKDSDSTLNICTKVLHQIGRSKPVGIRTPDISFRTTCHLTPRNTTVCR